MTYIPCGAYTPQQTFLWQAMLSNTDLSVIWYREKHRVENLWKAFKFCSEISSNLLFGMAMMLICAHEIDHILEIEANIIYALEAIKSFRNCIPYIFRFIICFIEWATNWHAHSTFQFITCSFGWIKIADCPRRSTNITVRHIAHWVVNRYSDII